MNGWNFEHHKKQIRLGTRRLCRFETAESGRPVAAQHYHQPADSLPVTTTTTVFTSDITTTTILPANIAHSHLVVLPIAFSLPAGTAQHTTNDQTELVRRTRAFSRVCEGPDVCTGCARVVWHSIRLSRAAITAGTQALAMPLRPSAMLLFQTYSVLLLQAKGGARL
jgi:hypothetical protein